MSLALAFPNIDPVIVSFGPVAIRWYALAYVLGLVLGWRYIRLLSKGAIPGLESRTADDFLVWCTLGVIVGGRLGYVIFYQPGYFIENPGQIPVIWQGGMSFHGGMLGVVAALYLFARQRKLNPLSVADAAACAVPIGLFFGRIANFINGELFGRASDVSWAMVFPNGGPEPRHPSQLYEAFLEGLVVFAVLTVLAFVFRYLPHRLFPVAHRRRAVPRARYLPRLYRQRHHHGPDPVAADAGDRDLSRAPHPALAADGGRRLVD